MDFAMIFFILVGERNDHGAVVLYLDTCGDQRFIHCSRQAPVIADRFTGGFHLWAEISIKSLESEIVIYKDQNTKLANKPVVVKVNQSKQ